MKIRFIKPLLCTIPFIEIALFIVVGSFIGIFWTLCLVILTTIIGFVLLRRQNTEMMQKMQMVFQSGQPPKMDVGKNSFTMFAGLLLIIPGFFTDLLGILLLIPYIRNQLISKLFKARMGANAANDSHTFNGEYWRDDNDKLPPNE